MTARALSLRDLVFRAHLLEDHLCVSALVGVGMIETHGGGATFVNDWKTARLDLWYGLLGSIGL
jgi:hypothetical protein